MTILQFYHIVVKMQLIKRTRNGQAKTDASEQKEEKMCRCQDA